jgi:hypothetical protein
MVLEDRQGFQSVEVGSKDMYETIKRMSTVKQPEEVGRELPKLEGDEEEYFR